VRKADKLPPSCAVVTKSGNLNFLEPSGPVLACNGTDLPFYIVCSSHIFVFIAAIIWKLDVFYIPLYLCLPDDNALSLKHVGDYVCMDDV